MGRFETLVGTAKISKNLVFTELGTMGRLFTPKPPHPTPLTPHASRFLVYHSILHHKTNLTNCLNVGRRIARNSNQIRKHLRLNAP